MPLSGSKRRMGGPTQYGTKKVKVMRRRPKARGIRVGGRSLKADTEYEFRRSVYIQGALQCLNGQQSSLGISVNLNQVNFNYKDGLGANSVIAATNIPGASDFTTLFNQWKVKSVSIKYIPRVDSIDPINSQVNFPTFPNLMMCTDYDDDLPTTRSEIVQRNDMKLAMLTKTITQTFRPKVSSNIWSGLISSGVTATGKGIAGSGTPWIDCGSPNVPWYGSKVVISGYPGAQTDMVVSIVYAFKGTV